MANPITSPMIIAAKMHKYFFRFENAGATSPEKSKTLESLGLHGGILFNRLLNEGVFIETSPGNYYVNSMNYDKYRAKRKKKVVMILGVVTLTFLALSYFL
jgi:hypothetical protein